ncbi:MAG: hypothetical protein ONB44_01550 [candidate division KSB1 bacterium]|nr:hypothetical protein [candidate division KSB1 bacterium]MDZ7300805.1 hypothetical protein [candidate division KSB1 bacterium]MDZ7309924.1 hypothetical protein [candidate division KSB1 bacterium]
MTNNLSEYLHYYILLSLFALLFVLQIWAMLKIKLMLQHVLAIYKRMQKMVISPDTGPAAQGDLQPSLKVGVHYKRVCECCRHRETFLEASAGSVFFYQCGLSKQMIELDDFCSRFEFDPQRVQI